jgi:hypothetical protein
MICGFAQVRVWDTFKNECLAILPVTNLQWSFEAGGTGGIGFTVSTWLPQLVDDPHLLDDCCVTVALPLVEGEALTEIEMYALRGDQTRTLVHRDGPAALDITISGARHVTEVWLSDAAVRPEASGADMPQDAGQERIFGWPSSSYDPDDDPTIWDNSVPISRAARYYWTEDGKRTYQTPKFPKAAASAGARWLTPQGGFGNRKLFRDWITIAADDTVVRFWFSSDESATLWCAGEAILSTSDVEFGKRNVHTAERTYNAGTYAIGIDTVTHRQTGGEGDVVDPVILAVCTLNDDGNNSSWLMVTDANTQSCRLHLAGAGARAPGPTPGAILITLLSEAQTRASDESQDSTLLELSVDFTASVDSEGTTWADAQETVHRYGTTIFNVADALSDFGLSVKVTPDKVLQAVWRGGENLSDGTAPVWVKQHTSLVARGVPALGCVADLFTRSGWTTVTETVAAGELGRRETMVELGTAPSLVHGGNLVLASLEDGLARHQEVLQGEFLAEQFATPYVDFVVSDKCLVGPPGSQISTRLLALGGSWDGQGPVVWHPVWGEVMRKSPIVFGQRMAKSQSQTAPGITGRMLSTSPVPTKMVTMRLPIPPDTSEDVDTGVEIVGADWFAPLRTSGSIVNQPVPNPTVVWCGQIDTGKYGVVVPRAVSPGVSYTPWWAVTVDVAIDGTPTIGTEQTFNGMADTINSWQASSVVGDLAGNMYVASPSRRSSTADRGLVVQHFDMTGTPTAGWGLFCAETSLWEFTQAAQFTNSNLLSTSVIDGDYLIVIAGWRTTNDTAGHRKVKVKAYAIDRTSGTLIDSVDVVGPTHSGTPSYADNIPLSLVKTATGEYVAEIFGSSSPSSYTPQGRLFPISFDGANLTVGTLVDLANDTGVVGLSGTGDGMQASISGLLVTTHATDLTDGSVGSGGTTYIDANNHDYRGGGGTFQQTSAGLINAYGVRVEASAPRGLAGLEIITCATTTSATSSVSEIPAPGTWNEGDGDDIEVDARNVTVAAEADRGLAVAPVYYEEDGSTPWYGLWLAPFTLT